MGEPDAGGVFGDRGGGGEGWCWRGGERVVLGVVKCEGVWCDGLRGERPSYLLAIGSGGGAGFRSSGGVECCLRRGLGRWVKGRDRLSSQGLDGRRPVRFVLPTGFVVCEIVEGGREV